MTKLRTIVAGLLGVIIFLAAGNVFALRDGRHRTFETRAMLLNYSPPEGKVIGYAVDTNQYFLRVGDQWQELGAESATYSFDFTNGASVGLQLMQLDATAFDSTAAAGNLLYYSRGFTGIVMNIVDVGATIPAATATGLDLAAGTNNDNDHFEMYMGVLGAVGRPITVGVDPAISLCVTVNITTVADFDLMNIGWRDATAVTASVTSYTDYCAIGIGSTAGQIYVNDKTTGGTDTTDVAVGGTAKTYCTLLSSAGVCTYTNDGSAPSTTDPHTLTSGILVIPFIAARNNTATPDPFDVTNITVDWQ